MNQESGPRNLDRPHDYRTPSPPPYSPILSPCLRPNVDAHLDTRPGWTSNLQTPEPFHIEHGHTFDSGDVHPGSKKPHGQSGHRSARSMDAFASIALATQYASTPSAIGKRAFDHTQPNERHKRHKHQHDYGQTYSRRKDAHKNGQITTPTVPTEEAQLLLHFAIEARAREVTSDRTYDSQITVKDAPSSQDLIEESVPQNNGGVDQETGGPPSTIVHSHKDGTANDQGEQIPLSAVLDGKTQREDFENSELSGEAATRKSIFHRHAATFAMQSDQSPHDQARPTLKSRSTSEPSGLPLHTNAHRLRSSSERPASYSISDNIVHSTPNDERGLRAPDSQSDRASNSVLGLDPVEQLPAVTNQSAVCAACNFAKNALSTDNDHGATSWISCDGCKSWFHFACAGFKTEREVRAVDKFRCKVCRPVHGSTSYVRKSSRAHASIDYAGLHQGVIKSSDDRPEHHYVAPIKSGATSFKPETFARMSPELVTADYFEKGGGMKEPIVIPASLNPRPRSSTDASLAVQEQVNSPIHFGVDQSANLEEWLDDDVISRLVPDDHQDGLDMVMPEGLTVRKVAELYGLEEKIEVIDVKSQNGESRKWTMKRWADYYDSTTEAKVIRNVISLEVSRSRLGRLIRRPQVVRDLDLQDSVWPAELFNKGEFPNVQFYCLMSVADCFTDFHIDFGGSSVFYHILKGKKTFLFIPPKEKHLKKYEEWCKSPAQNWTFLPDQTKECYRVDLEEGDTMLIPSGWIHAVWTPEDSLVIGGNFLTRMNYGMQFRVHQIEKATGVARKFRYPHFQKLHWFTVFHYLETDPLPLVVRNHLEGGRSFDRETPSAHEFNEWGENSKSGPENYHARYYSQPELDGLPELLRYILRTVLIDNGTIVEGISADVRNAVKKSIPRTHGDPSDLIKTFAIWCAWKRGNEQIPYWAYPDTPISGTASDKISANVSKKLTEEAASKAPRRQSQRMQAQKEAARPLQQGIEGDPLFHDTALLAEYVANDTTYSAVKRNIEQVDDHVAANGICPIPKKPRLSSGSSGSQRKTACDSCRRRRRACKHKETGESVNMNSTAEATPSHSVHKEALLNGSALQEKLSSLGGLFNALKPDGIQNASISLSSFQDNSGQDLAHEVVSTASPVAATASLPSLQEDAGGDVSAVSDVGGSRPRTKACNHCRKSKRRCIHDAFGNEDPIKVAESAVPRPHARKINKGESVSGSHGVSPESDYPYTAVPHQEPSVTVEVSSEQRIAPTVNMLTAPALANGNGMGTADENSAADHHGRPHIIPLHRTSTPPKAEYVVERMSDVSFGSQSDEHPSAPRELQHATIGYENPTLPEAQPQYTGFDQGVVSPPTSSGNAMEETPPYPSAARLNSWSKSRETSPIQRRGSHIYTPDSGPIKRIGQTSLHERSAGHDLLASKGRASTSIPEADEESLKLIKELQAQDLGLRRRGKT